MNLALFDLDNTLLGGDSDYLWGQFLAEQGVVDAAHYQRENLRFYKEYQAGTLDIHSFLEFQLTPLTQHPPDVLHGWVDRLGQHVAGGRVAVHEHRRRSDPLDGLDACLVDDKFTTLKQTDEMLPDIRNSG